MTMLQLSTAAPASSACIISVATRTNSTSPSSATATLAAAQPTPSPSINKTQRKQNFQKSNDFQMEGPAKGKRRTTTKMFRKSKGVSDVDWAVKDYETKILERVSAMSISSTSIPCPTPWANEMEDQSSVAEVSFTNEELTTTNTDGDTLHPSSSLKNQRSFSVSLALPPAPPASHNMFSSPAPISPVNALRTPPTTRCIRNKRKPSYVTTPIWTNSNSNASASFNQLDFTSLLPSLTPPLLERNNQNAIETPQIKNTTRGADSNIADAKTITSSGSASTGYKSRPHKRRALGSRRGATGMLFSETPEFPILPEDYDIDKIDDNEEENELLSQLTFPNYPMESISKQLRTKRRSTTKQQGAMQSRPSRSCFSPFKSSKNVRNNTSIYDERLQRMGLSTNKRSYQQNENDHFVETSRKMLPTGNNDSWEGATQTGLKNDYHRYDGTTTSPEDISFSSSSFCSTSPRNERGNVVVTDILRGCDLKSVTFSMPSLSGSVSQHQVVLSPSATATTTTECAGDEGNSSTSSPSGSSLTSTEGFVMNMQSSLEEGLSTPTFLPRFVDSKFDSYNTKEGRNGIMKNRATKSQRRRSGLRPRRRRRTTAPVTPAVVRLPMRSSPSLCLNALSGGGLFGTAHYSGSEAMTPAPPTMPRFVPKLPGTTPAECDDRAIKADLSPFQEFARSMEDDRQMRTSSVVEGVLDRRCSQEQQESPHASPVLPVF